MKQMQKPEYKMARKINLEIQQLDDENAPVSSGNYNQSISYTNCFNLTILS